jgi:hypothetical protein
MAITKASNPPGHNATEPERLPFHEAVSGSAKAAFLTAIMTALLGVRIGSGGPNLTFRFF